MNFTNVIFIIFKLICILTSLSMVVFWIIKFQRNEDITVIDYAPIYKMETVANPEVSICVDNPFLNDKLGEISKELNSEMYLKYLRGEKILNQTAKNISYDYVTLNVFDYLNYVNIIWKPETKKIQEICTDINNCPYFDFQNNFNGFYLQHIYKCFGIKIKSIYEKSVRSIILTFNDTLREILPEFGQKFVMFNYPQQILRNLGGSHNIWQNKEKTKTSEFFQITFIEILKRRNKNNNPCLVEWMNFDKIIMKKHIESIGCRAPYQKPYNEYPTCNTQKEMKDSVYEGKRLASQYVHVPCQEMSNLVYKHNLQENFFIRQTLEIVIFYPDKAKIITQSQAVDGHSLIGNIGGYIGLFLGIYCIATLRGVISAFPIFSNIYLYLYL